MQRFSTHGRRGISVLEVLISIGVVAIGLLGVASLIPVAYHQALQGTRNDRTALVGRRAFREFRVRGMDRPQTWYAAQAGHLFDPTNGKLRRRSWVIDPRGYAAYAALSGVNAGAFPASANFPSLTNRLQRVTLRAAVTINNLGSPLPSTSNAMSLQQADEIFICHDDLAVEIPEGDAVAPLQKLWAYDGTNTAIIDVPTPQAIKRYAEGDFSWLATLVPQALNDAYTLSIAVCHHRVLDPTREYFGRVQVRTAQGRSFAVTGGELAIEVPNTKEVHQAIRPNGWMLLTQPQPLPGSPPELMARWYRIVLTDGDADEAAESSGATLVRSLTVSGADWEVTPGNQSPVMAIFMPEVVGVYEKTIHLDSSSVWPE